MESDVSHTAMGKKKNKLKKKLQYERKLPSVEGHSSSSHSQRLKARFPL